MAHIIGIDLGTTNSLVFYWDGEKSCPIPNAHGEYLTPSVVSFDDDGTVFVGKIAKERKETHPDSTFESFKRYMGRDHTFSCSAGKFTSTELSAFVLRFLKEDAERFFGEEVTEAVISVPAYFNDRARNATKQAGQIAGLKVDRIINEPSAASLGYMVQKGILNMDSEDGFDERTLLVFDFGGGTLDVSMVDTFDNVVEIITVSGDNMLGGIDFDRAIADWFIKTTHLEEAAKKPEVRFAILAAAERAKIALTENTSARMVVNYGEISETASLKDVEMAQICASVLQRIYTPVNNMLLDSGRTIDEITDIVMVGGSSKMPVVQQYLKHILHRSEIEVFDPDRIVAKGMGVYAGIKERDEQVKDLLLTDVCPFSLGTNINNKRNEDKPLSSFVIERNSPLPISRTHNYHPSKDGQEIVIFRIFQGEEMYSDDNRALGDITIHFPTPASTNTTLQLTFTYDINGILLVNVEVPDYNISIERVFTDVDGITSEEGLEEKIKKLKSYRTLATDDEDNRMVMEWGKRLFAQAPPSMKMPISARLQFFDDMLDRDPYQAEKIKKHLKLYFVALEVSLQGYTVSNWQYNDDWMDDEDNEIEELFRKWERNEAPKSIEGASNPAKDSEKKDDE